MNDAGYVEAIASLVSQTGNDGFSSSFNRLLNTVAAVDLCSAFAVQPDGSLRYLFACGDYEMSPGFAEEASWAYLLRFWRRDRISRQVFAEKSEGGSIRVLRQSPASISDAEYRRDCYERAEVVERLSFYHAAEPRLFASAYRARPRGGFDALERERLEQLAPILIATLAKHVTIMDDSFASARLSPAQIAACLQSCDPILSRREVEVASAMIAGWTQHDICARSGISFASVVTYRKRAYQKLGVTNRRELQRLYDARLAGTRSTSRGEVP
ncbi:helix-turn-helix transcriptional regulator [Aliihoeflea sp. PC F10.4]